MHVHGAHRPITTHADQPAEPVRIDADGDTWEQTKAALRSQVPKGHQLLHIIVGD